MTHAAVVLHCALVDFVTFDEVGNLAAGVAYLENGDYGLYNVNPPLTKLLAAAPVLVAGADTGPVVYHDIPGDRSEWDVGDHFARANADRYHTLVVLGRLPGVGWALLGAILVYAWARELWGSAGGVVALTSWCFEPNVIAHAHLITADLPAAVGALAAAYVFRRYLAAPTWALATAAGAVLGTALLCKFTLLVLCPLWGIVATGFAARDWPKVGCRGLVVRAWQFALLAGVALLVVNAGYEFTGVGKPLGGYRFLTRSLQHEAGTQPPPEGGGNRFQGTWLGCLPVPLPEPLVRGIDVQRAGMEHARTQRYYLAGTWKTGGWWYYYLYAAAVKVPIGVIILFFGGIGLLVVDRRARPTWRELLLLGLPFAAIVVAAMSQTSIQRHFRYVLPAMPFALVLLGATTDSWRTRPAWWRVGVAVVVIWVAGSYLRVHPHALAYFNEPAGGPGQGHLHLLGSNIEWGQDLLRVKRWISEHPEAAGMRIAYCNHIDPRVAGLAFAPPPVGPTGPTPPDAEEASHCGPRPGYHAVSISLIMGYETTIPDGQGNYLYVPFGGYSYFQRLAPIDRAGYTMLIYHITPERANALRRDMGLLPLATDPEATRPHESRTR